MEGAFADAVGRDDEDPILALGAAYRLLLREDSGTLRLHMHALAVAGDREVGQAVTGHYVGLLERYARSLGGDGGPRADMLRHRPDSDRRHGPGPAEPPRRPAPGDQAPGLRGAGMSVIGRLNPTPRKAAR